jgi:hypothetical protein
MIFLALCECSHAAGGWRRRDDNDEEIHNVAVWALHEKYPNLGKNVDFTVKQAMSQVILLPLLRYSYFSYVPLTFLVVLCVSLFFFLFSLRSS